MSKNYANETVMLADCLCKVYKDEDIMQADCFQWSWNFRPRTRRLIWHVPNGKKRNKIEAMQLKAMGVVAGVHDMHFYWQSQLYIIELKVLGNTLSKQQEAYRDAMILQGVVYYECRSFAAWITIIDSILSQQPRTTVDRILGWFENTFGLRI